MSDNELLQAEVARLRAEVESYKQQELVSLRSQLAAALEAANHYKNECYRLSQVAKDIDNNAMETINKLKAELEAKQRNEVFSRRQAITSHVNKTNKN